MTVLRRFTVLGCSSSPGVPRINGDWGACDPANLKNRRTRSSFLIEQIAENGGITTIVIDTGPDFRAQMIAANVKNIDAVVYSHAHADHLHGMDDLRGFVMGGKSRIPIYADADTLERIRQGFSYCLETPVGSNYPPIAKAHLIRSPEDELTIGGDGGSLTLQPLLQEHGSIHSLGFRIGNIAYCSDVSDFPSPTIEKLQGLDILFLDTLQYKRHPSHLSLEQSLEWIARLAPKHAVLTHMHTPLDYETVLNETPDHVEPAYDQMTFTIELPQH